MKRISSVISLSIAFFLWACAPEEPSAEHVIILGFDAMSSLGIQRAVTPNFNHMIENGAVSLHTRCIRETSSSQNWMTMVSAAPIEMHGVLTNSWKPASGENILPALANGKGLFPTIFDFIREQKPDLRQYAFIDWAGETRMYDMEAFDSSYVRGSYPGMENYKDVLDKAFSKYLEDRPQMMFVSIDITDHIGHTYGHESEEYLSCVSEMDSLTGVFIRELEARGWMKNTVIIVTADHGGLGPGHGGDTMAEYEIPIILFGGNVTAGKVMKRTNMIYDVGATAAGLLGVKLPWECRGKVLSEAFEPSDGEVYVPVPMAHPFSGRATENVTLTADADNVEIFYTLDGSAPDMNSIRYDGPFPISEATRLRSVAYRNGCRSIEAENFLNPDGFDAPVYFKLYKNIAELVMPDFTKYGVPSQTGYTDGFSLDGLGVSEEDHFAALFVSNLIVEKEAEYRFMVISDDGANLFIDGELLVDNSSAHSRMPKFGTLKLSEGRHPVKVEFYEHSSVQNLNISVSIDGAPFRPLMATDLDR